MRSITNLVLLMTFLLPFDLNAKEPSYTHHQTYRGTTVQGIEAVKQAFATIGLGVLGVDEEMGIVTSRSLNVDVEDVKDIARFNKAAEVFYFLIAFVTLRDEGQIEVQILTVLRARSPDTRLAEGGFYSSGNVLAENVYQQIEEHLGPGLLSSAWE